MKTRQEMIYDFMVGLSANGDVFKDWQANMEIVGGYGDHIQSLAEELADNFLRNLA